MDLTIFSKPRLNVSQLCRGFVFDYIVQHLLKIAGAVDKGTQLKGVSTDLQQRRREEW